MGTDTMPKLRTSVILEFEVFVHTRKVTCQPGDGVEKCRVTMSLEYYGTHWHLEEFDWAEVQLMAAKLPVSELKGVLLRGMELMQEQRIDPCSVRGWKRWLRGSLVHEIKGMWREQNS